MADKVRIAIIGAGGIANWHIKGFQHHADRCTVVAAVDTSRERADEKKDKYGLDEALYSADEVWGRADIDAVSICLPHHLHEPFVVAAAQAGKHILCEKPFALSVASLDRMAQACDDAGVTCMSAQVLRFRACHRAGRDFARSGKLGAIKHVWRRRSGMSRGLSTEWYFDLEKAGRMVVHGYGSHEYDTLMWLADTTCESIYAQGATVNPLWGSEDEVSGIWRLSNGAVANMRQSLNTTDAGWDQVMMGDLGCLFIGTEKLSFKPYEGEEEVQEHPMGDFVGFDGETGEFLSAVIEGREAEASPRQVRWCQAAMEATALSIEQNRIVNLREEFGDRFGPISAS